MLYIRIIRTHVVFSSYMYVEKTTFVRKICTYNIDEIDTWKMMAKLTIVAIYCPAIVQDPKGGVILIGGHGKFDHTMFILFNFFSFSCLSWNQREQIILL